MRFPTAAWGNWFAGFVDGEGSFIITRNRGQWVRAEFRLNMRADDKPILKEIKEELGIGFVYDNRKSGNKNPNCEFRVSHREQLLHLVKLFDQYPLKSRKMNDYQVWRTFVILHQSRKKAMDLHVEQLLGDIRSAREFKEGE